VREAKETGASESTGESRMAAFLQK